MVNTALRYFYQLRYLKWVQIYWRIRLRLRSPRVIDSTGYPALMMPPGNWVSPASMPHRVYAPDRFSMLGQELPLLLPAGWQDLAPGKKWLMELHTFNYLGSQSADLDRALIQSWIDNNPAYGGPGWHPYMTSQRIASWLKWGLSSGEVDATVRASLAQQVNYLLQVLAYNELDHKLFSNGKALLFAGWCLDDPDAHLWRARGAALVLRFSRELLGEDGGYTGLSPMYHCALLSDMLDVVNLLQAFNQPVPGYLARAIALARFWLACLCHPDGQFALFNDSAFEVGAAPSQLHDYARRLGYPPVAAPENGLVHLGASGFARMAVGTAGALVDIGKIGPDHFPSHGHADTFTFELSLGKQRIIVDTGLSTYEDLEARLWQRGTGAHNTVQVDNRNSSDVWQLFKVGRRAAVADVTVHSSAEVLRVSASHDGYSRPYNPLVHHREWEVSTGQLKIIDRLTGRGPHHEVRVAFHLHPDVIAKQMHPHRFSLEIVGGGPLGELELAHGLVVAVEAYDYHPEFGQSLAGTRITGRAAGALPMEFTSLISWAN